MYTACRYDKAWHLDKVSPWCAAFTEDDLSVSPTISPDSLKRLKSPIYLFKKCAPLSSPHLLLLAFYYHVSMVGTCTFNSKTNAEGDTHMEHPSDQLCCPSTGAVTKNYP